MADAVRKWLEKGVPDVHWGILMRLAGVSLEEIYEANMKVRGQVQRANGAPRPRPRRRQQQGMAA